MSETSLEKRVVDHVERNALNILFGREELHHLYIDQYLVKKVGERPNSLSFDTGHPEKLEIQVVEFINDFLNMDDIFILRTNRYCVMKVVQLIAMEGSINLNWILCDGDGVESRRGTTMPSNSITKYSVDLFERDLRIKFEDDEHSSR